MCPAISSLGPARLWGFEKPHNLMGFEIGPLVREVDGVERRLQGRAGGALKMAQAKAKTWPSLDHVSQGGRLRVGWLNGRGTARAEDAQWTPTQESYITKYTSIRRLPLVREVDGVERRVQGPKWLKLRPKSGRDWLMCSKFAVGGTAGRRG